MKELEKSEGDQLILATVFLGVRAVITAGWVSMQKDPEFLYSRLTTILKVLGVMRKMSPKMFMDIFPIVGEGDYYYLLDFEYGYEEYEEYEDNLKEITYFPLKETIRYEIEIFIEHYMNKEIMDFRKEYISTLNEIEELSKKEEGILESSSS